MSHLETAPLHNAHLVVSQNDAAVFLLSLATHVYFGPHFIRFSFVTSSLARWCGDHFHNPAAVPWALGSQLSCCAFLLSHNTTDVGLVKMGYNSTF